MPDEVILQWGNPALHERARQVDSFDDLLRAQARRLSRRLVAVGGAGLAATQVGVLRRMFAFRLSPEHEVAVLVNPRLVWRSHELALFHEGCLSFDSVLVAVTRPARVRVVGCDLHGQERDFECEGFDASLMQHETDHLDGILTLDRADPSERSRAVSALLASRTQTLATAA